MKRKKLLCLTCYGILFIMAAAGCGNHNTENQNKKLQETINKDQANEKKDVVSASNSIDLEKYKNKIDVFGENDYTISSDLEVMGEHSENVVEAEILSVDYLSYKGFPNTKLRLKILNSYKGDLKENEQIDIYKGGGYVPLKEFIEYMASPSDYSYMSEEEIETTLFHIVIDGEEEPVIGNVAIYFLEKTERSFIPEDGYEPVCGKYSILEKMEEDSYRHLNMGPSKTNREFDDLSVEEIKEEINDNRL